MNYITKELQQEIQNSFFSNYKLINGKTLNIYIAKSFFSDNEKYLNICKSILNIQPLYESIYAILNCILNDLDLVECCICGKKVSYTISKRNWKNSKHYHCSKECFKKDKSFHKLKYEQRKEKMMQHYGVENVFQLNDVKKKIASTNIKKFGVANPFQSSEIIKKIEQKNIEKYGHKYILQSEYGKQKTKDTLIEKYNVDNISKNKEHKEQITVNECRTLRIKSYNEYILTDNRYTPMFTLDEYIKSYSPSTIFKWKCNNCNNVFESTYDNGHHRSCPYCRKLSMSNHLSRSHYEDEIIQYIKTFYKGDIILNTRDVITPYELDIFIPDKKLAIEFNGTYWHSSKVSNDNMKHLAKTILCENQNIALIHIFEFDWNVLHKQKQLKAFIKTLIENNNVYKINSSEEMLFLDYSLFSRAITIPNYYYFTSYGPYLINKQDNLIYINGEIVFKRIT